MRNIHSSLHKATIIWGASLLLTWIVGIMLLVVAPFLPDFAPLDWPTWPVALAGGHVMIVCPVLFIIIIRRYRRASWILAHAIPQSRVVIAIETIRTRGGWYYKVRLAEGEQPREVMRILIPPHKSVVKVGDVVSLYLDPPANRMVALQAPSGEIAWLAWSYF